MEATAIVQTRLEQTGPKGTYLRNPEEENSIGFVNGL